MSVVRDPAFWKRFSTAVHLDEEATAQSPVASPSSSRPALKHTESWLDQQHKKRRRSYWLMTLLLLLFLAVIAVVAVVLVYLAQHGWSEAFQKGAQE